MLVDVRDKEAFSSAFCLIGTSCLKVGMGGGNGDIDMEVTLAECAWYTRRGRSSGKESTCFARLVEVTPFQRLMPAMMVPLQ